MHLPKKKVLRVMAPFSVHPLAAFDRAYSLACYSVKVLARAI
jgi:hypothetical protein